MNWIIGLPRSHLGLRSLVKKSLQILANQTTNLIPPIQAYISEFILLIKKVLFELFIFSSSLNLSNCSFNKGHLRSYTKYELIKWYTYITHNVTVTGSFIPDGAGSILKMYNEAEKKCLEALSTDVLRPYVPEFLGEATTPNGKRILSVISIIHPILILFLTVPTVFLTVVTITFLTRGR